MLKISRMRKIISFIIISLLITSCSTAFRDITVQMPDLTLLNDGIYRGIYDLSGTPIKVILDVTIQRNRILHIEIVQHNSSPIGRRAESIINYVIEKQSLEIDAVSGATASSKAILKAIEKALRSN